MKSILEYISSHPLAVMAAAFFALLTVYFIFKQLIKLALFIALIALAVGGYYYFKDPQKMPENIRQTIKDARDKSDKLVEKSKQAYKKTKDIYEKSKELTKEAGDFLQKKEEK
jgi:ABC-type bacteriocin/lantibiotic exporter with double-glycine peptidase domain